MLELAPLSPQKRQTHSYIYKYEETLSPVSRPHYPGQLYDGLPRFQLKAQRRHLTRKKMSGNCCGTEPRPHFDESRYS